MKESHLGCPIKLSITTPISKDNKNDQFNHIPITNTTKSNPIILQPKATNPKTTHIPTMKQGASIPTIKQTVSIPSAKFITSTSLISIHIPSTPLISTAKDLPSTTLTSESSISISSESISTSPTLTSESSISTSPILTSESSISTSPILTSNRRFQHLQF